MIHLRRPVSTAARIALGALAAFALSGCLTLRSERVGPPLRSRHGEPRDDCERRGWLDLRATHLTAHTFGQGGAAPSGDPRDAHGFAIYRRHTARDVPPLPVEQGLALASADDLVRARDARLRPTRVRVGAAVVLRAIGGVILLTIPRAHVLREEDLVSRTAAAVVAGTLALTLGMLMEPTTEERAREALRTQMLIPGEDDLDDVRLRLDLHNALVRARCGNTAPASAPDAPPAPPDDAAPALPTAATPWRR